MGTGMRGAWALPRPGEAEPASSWGAQAATPPWESARRGSRAAVLTPGCTFTPTGATGRDFSFTFRTSTEGCVCKEKCVR